MKNTVLSVKQPHATLICAGVKRVENRTWKTDYRGKLLVHASGEAMSFYDFDKMPQDWCNLFADYIEKYDNFMPPEEAPETIQESVSAKAENEPQHNHELADLDYTLTIVFPNNREKADFMRKIRKDPKEKFIKSNILYDISKGIFDISVFGGRE